MRPEFLAVILVTVLLVSGCAQQNAVSNSANQQQGTNQAEFAKNACISYCFSLFSSGANLNSGPCLLNPIPDSDWVCDVAHSPRAGVDNFPENQCSSYGSASSHFVEVTPICKFIRSE